LRPGVEPQRPREPRGDGCGDLVLAPDVEVTAVRIELGLPEAACLAADERFSLL